MDPNACYERMCDAIKLGELDEARFAASELQTWLRNGGFPPGALARFRIDKPVLIKILEGFETVLTWVGNDLTQHG